ncbi:MAG: virulence protein RhuM/Fic/DOC family protein [Candidatus Kapabacteria bacterium]|nr:virulence protein RhuM/Fic/DOC family protein [Ignavibacteriota bacterium]MCW5884052.1 virulence protein RhuM/Fic/DOC family protein [Candidatus Kapabacteria bacterium]
MNTKGEIVIYQNSESKLQVEVKLLDDTLWLSLNQISALFGRDKSSISRHIRNIFKTGELDMNSTVAKFATVQTEGSRKIERIIEFYNLDVIISVGYRVNSKEGTQFRIWANNVLKNYLIKGFAINENSIRKERSMLVELKQVIKFISENNLSDMIDDEIKTDFMRILDKYSSALFILDSYDNQKLNNFAHENETCYKIEYEEVIKIIEEMRKVNFDTQLFGLEKDESMKSSISAIYQTFNGNDLYPSILEKAVNLLYFIVKNHSFVDGNKRIAASIFLYFLSKNERLSKVNLDNNLLAALTLLIANSKPIERKLITNIITTMLQQF